MRSHTRPYLGHATLPMHVTEHKIWTAWPWPFCSSLPLQDFHPAPLRPPYPISGVIPSAYAKFSSLRQLLLNQNSLSGVLPPELAEMSSLEVLDISSNAAITGPIPEAWGCGAWRHSLRELVMWGCDLTGALPQLEGMVALEILVIHGNRMVGPLPASVGPAMRELRLSHNPLNCEIPLQWGDFPLMEVLEIDGCELHGHIPRSLLGSNTIKDLNLADNPGLIKDFDADEIMHVSPLKLPRPSEVLSAAEVTEVLDDWNDESEDEGGFWVEGEGEGEGEGKAKPMKKQGSFRRDAEGGPPLTTREPRARRGSITL